MHDNHSRNHIGIGRALALVGLLATGACSRSLPSSWPATSPLSPEAPAAAAANVTLALDADPPLPGEPREGWTGLEDAAAAPDTAAPEAGHHQHHVPAGEGAKHDH